MNINLKEIKLIGFDLDETVMTTDKRVTEYTKKVLETALARGIAVMPATGRPITDIPEDIRKLPGLRYAVVSNGARILDLEKGETLFERTISAEKAGKILDIYKKYDTLREVYCDGKAYVDKDKLEYIEDYIKFPDIARYIVDTRIPTDNLETKIREDGRNVDKVQASFRNAGDKTAAVEQVRALGGVEPTEIFKDTIEANGENVNKGAALLWLGERLGIVREEILAFGDGDNDIAMLETVGTGVAMENAIPEVKAVADYLAGLNDEDGVARFIEKYII